MSEHFDDAPYNQGDISQVRARVMNVDIDEELAKWAVLRGYAHTSDEPEQTSAVLNNWWVSDPRNWE